MENLIFPVSKRFEKFSVVYQKATIFNDLMWFFYLCKPSPDIINYNVN